MRILVIAYACDPSEGSEPGVGWMWSRLLAQLGHATVITRRNNKESIEARLASTPEAARIEFVYVDLPAWTRIWKKGQRGARLYYVIWQFAALRAARDVARRATFDLAWHVTFANYWLGSVGGHLRLPFVWGPLGGGVRSCFDIRLVGARGLLFELSRSTARVLGRWANPLARSAWRRASLVLVNNPDVRDALPTRYRYKCVVFPSVLLDPDPRRKSIAPPAPKTAMFAGRLIAWKGCSLAVRAIALLPEWRLVVCGGGPDEDRVKRLARKLGIDHRVEFVGWAPREEVHRLMRERAHVFVFPSLHDDAGWAVGEAVAHGLPVVCLDRGGPPIIARGRGLAVTRPTDIAGAIAEATTAARRESPSEAWDLDTRSRDLRSIVDRYLTRPIGHPRERRRMEAG